MGEHAGTAEARSRVGTRLNAEWTIDAVLGAGGMAAVFAATDKSGRRAALKVLHAQVANEAGVRERFRREARVAQSIDHPARAAVHGTGTSDLGEPFLVMDLLDGEPLDAALGRRGPLPLDETLRIFDVVLDLLAHCHERGIVHCDIKPGNVFLLTGGGVRVIDFGIARVHGEQDDVPPESDEGAPVGTPSFMSPEQALGSAAVDGRADLWSVGACIFTSLSGRRLNEAQTENEAILLAASKPAPSIATVMPELSVEAVAFVDKALAYDRAQRFPDAQTMRRELGALLAASAAGVLASGVKKQAGVLARSNDVVDESILSDEELERATSYLSQFWRYVASYMATVVQYGWTHPATLRALKAASHSATEALSAMPDAVRWDVTSHELSLQGASVWAPDHAPFDRMPFQLYADGLRRVQLKPGFNDDELQHLVKVMMREPGESSDDDDAVTALWARRFDHLAYVAVDAFALGDDSEEGQTAFNTARDAVMEDVLKLSQIGKDWRDDSLEARAMQRNLAATMREAANSASLLGLDATWRNTLATIAARDSDESKERHLDAMLDALVEADRAGDTGALTEALAEYSSDLIKLRQYGQPTKTMQALERGLVPRLGDRAAALGRELWKASFSAEIARRALTQILDDTAAGIPVVDVEALGHMIERLDDDGLFDSAIEAIRRPESSTAVREMLVKYVDRHARGHEAQIGECLQVVDERLALRLTDVLARLETPEAGAAIAKGTTHAAAAVRRESARKAVALVPTSMTTAFDMLLDDTDALVRTEAIRLVTEHKMRDVGPAVVRRITEPRFVNRPTAEQKSLFECLDRLSGNRAESVAIELLDSQQMTPSPALDRARAVAAEFLGTKSSAEAIGALKKAARSFLRNTAVLRDAAKAALARIEAESK